MFLIAIKKNAGRRSCGYKRRRHKKLQLLRIEVLASLYLVGPAFNALCLKTSLFLLTCTLNCYRPL